MQFHHRVLFAGLFAALTLTSSAQDKRIERSAVPPTVEKTIQAQSQGATVKAIATELEHGKMQYEVETMVNGRSRDLAIATDGRLLEVEEEVAFTALPAGVQSALTAKAAGAKITKVESLTKKDKLVAYEATTLRGAKKGEIQVGPKGEALKHEE
jgi:hypothetical protein